MKLHSKKSSLYIFITSQWINTLSVVFLLLLNGCTTGWIYTNTIQPECINLHSTELGTLTAIGSAKKIEIPLSRLNLTASWDSKGIGDISKEHGMTEILGCDAKTLSIFGGIYQNSSILVYGR